MELGKINENVYYLPHEVKTDRPILGYIKGERFSLMVDAGNSPMHVAKFYGELAEFGFPVPDFTVLTHWHWDHSFGLCAVKGVTIAHKQTNEKLAGLLDWEWSEEAMDKRLQDGLEVEMADTCIRLEYPDVEKIKIQTAQVTFEGKLCFALGGVHCEVMKIPSPHSKDCVSVYVPEEKVVFLGDATSGDFYGGNQYNKMDTKYLIEYLENLDADICMLGHTEPITKNGVLIYLKGIYETLE